MILKGMIHVTIGYTRHFVNIKARPIKISKYPISQINSVTHNT